MISSGPVIEHQIPADVRPIWRTPHRGGWKNRCRICSSKALTEKKLTVVGDYDFSTDTESQWKAKVDFV
jgi:hypothetical protein